jgi:hypothetical protein
MGKKKKALAALITEEMEKRRSWASKFASIVRYQSSYSESVNINIGSSRINFNRSRSLMTIPGTFNWRCSRVWSDVIPPRVKMADYVSHVCIDLWSWCWRSAQEISSGPIDVYRVVKKWNKNVWMHMSWNFINSNRPQIFLVSQIRHCI